MGSSVPRSWSGGGGPAETNATVGARDAILARQPFRMIEPQLAHALLNSRSFPQAGGNGTFGVLRAVGTCCGTTMIRVSDIRAIVTANARQQAWTVRIRPGRTLKAFVLIRAKSAGLALTALCPDHKLTRVALDREEGGLHESTIETVILVQFCVRNGAESPNARKVFLVRDGNIEQLVARVKAPVFTILGARVRDTKQQKPGRNWLDTAQQSGGVV